MKIGKLPEPVLVRSVIKQVKHRRKEILTGPAVGVDCAALETSPGEVLVIGDAVPIPLKIKVELAKERPQSRTIDFWDVWKEGSKTDLVRGIDRYMNS